MYIWFYLGIAKVLSKSVVPVTFPPAMFEVVLYRIALPIKYSNILLHF